MLTKDPISLASFRQYNLTPQDSFLNANTLSYIEYSWTPGSEIESPSQDDTLYLASLFFIQKKYRQCLHQLTKIDRISTLSAQSIEMIKKVFFNKEITECTVNDCAIMLEVYIIVKMRSPLSTFDIESETYCSKLSLNTIYKKYLDNYSFIDRALIIPENDERFLLEHRHLPYPHRTQELNEEPSFNAVQKFEPCGHNIPHWDEIDTFNKLKLNVQGFTAELIKTPQEYLPGSYFQLDLKRHFADCYNLLRNRTQEAQSRSRCDVLIYHLMLLANSPMVQERNRAPVKLLEFLFNVYKDPLSFRTKIPTKRVDLLSYLENLMSINLGVFQEKLRIELQTHNKVSALSLIDEDSPSFSLDELPSCDPNFFPPDLSDLNVKTSFVMCYNILRDHSTPNQPNRFELLCRIIRISEKILLI